MRTNFQVTLLDIISIPKRINAKHFHTRDATAITITLTPKKCATESVQACIFQQKISILPLSSNLIFISFSVLSQCERLREKNLRISEKYNKPTFMPKCDSNTGIWEAVQCLDHVGVCWCVTPQGEPLKGTLTRGAQPECNFRQARNRAKSRSDVISDADLGKLTLVFTIKLFFLKHNMKLVLEELMMQLGTFDEEEPVDINLAENPLPELEFPLRTRCEALGSQCDNDGKFLPIQCDQELCWCVDEAGNQLPNTDTFKKGERICRKKNVISLN